MIKKLWGLACKYPKTSAVIAAILIGMSLLRDLTEPKTPPQPVPEVASTPFESNPDVPTDKVLTTEQAKKVVEDGNTASECNTRASAGEPGTENALWDDEVKIPVIQAYRERGQEVTPDTEAFLYDLAQIASYKSEIEKLPEQEVLEGLQSWILDYTRFQITPNLTDRTPEIALEVGVQIYYPALVERARTKCADLYQEDGIQGTQDTQEDMD